MVNIKSLEKRVAKLEEELTALKSRHHDSEPHHTSKHHKTAKHHKGKQAKTKKKGKRPLNAYFKIMLAAKKAGKPSFVYKGKTYKGTKDKRFGMIYKKA